MKKFIISIHPNSQFLVESFIIVIIVASVNAAFGSLTLVPERRKNEQTYSYFIIHMDNSRMEGSFVVSCSSWKYQLDQFWLQKAFFN